MSKNDRTKSLLSDLGKPTLRGVRKCPKCGTFNGTRGISCKNKQCRAVFKIQKETPSDEIATSSSASRRQKVASPEAMKIITGNTDQVYSVRVRDRGPDYRGFVQLPNLPVATGDGGEQTTVATEDAIARCFVETCIRFVPEENEVQPDTCQHIKATLKCDLEAEPLALKNSVLNALNVSPEVKQAVWLLATESPGPLVQRVSKTVMVVKCKVDLRHPLGFLHFSFFESSKNKNSVPEYKFNCTCKEFRTFRLQTHRTAPIQHDENHRRCVHFYACICAFASDETLAEEFSYCVNLDMAAVTELHLATILNENQHHVGSCKFEVVVVAPESSPLVTGKMRKRRRAEGNAALETLQEGIFNDMKKAQGKGGRTPVEESHVSVTFLGWLAGITECINQTMHYQFDGHPDPLVFHVPQSFFDCLQQRISHGFKKRRLPNATTTFYRSDALPLGIFSKYAWHITNVLHVKQIFDTPLVSLDITRSFVENRDGTFDLYEMPKQVLTLDHGISETFKKAETQPPIRPFELKTFLKVGYTSPDQKQSTPFVIEWIPDILPRAKVGELTLKFKYGHQRNGQIEVRPTQPIQCADHLEITLT